MRQLPEFLRSIVGGPDHGATYLSHKNLDVADFIVGNCPLIQEITVYDDEVRKLTGFEGAGQIFRHVELGGLD